MRKRQNYSSGSAFEDLYGYSRAVKVGSRLYIAGTIGMNYATGEIPADPVAQLDQIVGNWQRPLADARASLRDIVQLTMYLTGQDVFEAIGPRMGEIFGGIRPTNTALVVRFPIAGVKLELQAVAEIGCGD